MIVGATITVNVAALVTVPAGVVTAMAPLVAPVGTVAVIWLAESTTYVALLPLKVTELAPVKLVPVIVTEAPTAPLVGEKLVIVGPRITVNVAALVAVPAGVVTAMAPLVAPAGTLAVIWLAELTTYVALLPLKVTELAPVKFVPVIVTEAPTAPLVGEKLVIVGPRITVNVAALVAVPAGVVTAMAPLVAPAGTVAVIWLAESTTYVALLPLKVTELAPVKLVPVIVTEAPTAPLVGEKLVIVGATITVNVAALVAVPAGVVTAMGPLVAPVGRWR